MCLQAQGAARHLRVQRRVQDRLRRLIATVAAALLLAAPARAQEPPALATVVTNGEAALSRPPDVAYLTLAVETRAKNPRDAQRQNAEAMAGVQKQIAAAGIPKDALRTIGLWLEQEFDNVNLRRVSRGFVARNTLDVRIDEVGRAGEIADAVVQGGVQGGATSLGGIRFDLKDRSAAEREALRLAVADARLRADAAASGAGRTVDRILKIEDSRADVIVASRMIMRADASAAQTAVEPGLIEVRARVVLTASMK